MRPSRPPMEMDAHSTGAGSGTVPYLNPFQSTVLPATVSLPLHVPVLGCVQNVPEHRSGPTEPFGTVGNGGYIMMY